MNIQRPVTALSLRLPSAGGKLERFDMSAPEDFPERVTGPLNRIALAAAHVVADPLAEVDPWLDGGARLGPHHRLPRAPLGPRPRRRRGDGHGAARHGARLADGARADQALGRGLEARATARWCSPAPAPTISTPPRRKSIDDVIRAYEEQVAAIEAVGGRIILMASRALARVAQDARRLRQGLRPHPRRR